MQQVQIMSISSKQIYAHSINCKRTCHETQLVPFQKIEVNSVTCGLQWFQQTESLSNVKSLYQNAFFLYHHKENIQPYKYIKE